MASAVVEQVARAICVERRGGCDAICEAENGMDRCRVCDFRQMHIDQARAAIAAYERAKAQEQSK